MTTIAYSALDALALGPSLEADMSGQVLTCNAPNLNSSRAARGTFGKSSGVWYFEVGFYANNLINGAPTALTGLGFVGIAQASESLSTFVGGDANAIGYAAGDGGIYSNNAFMSGTTPAGGTGSVTLNATNVLPTQLNTWIGVLVDLNALTITFSVNGAVFATAAVPSGKTWFPAMTVCGPALGAYAINGFLNTGQRAFKFPQSTAPGGWFKIFASQTLPVYLTTDFEGGYTSANSDTPQNAIFNPRILSADSLTISQICTVWLWGQSGASATYGSMTLDNFDGAYDYLTQGDWRDAVVTFMQVPGGAALTSAVPLATVLIDTIYSGGGSSLGASSGTSTPANEQTVTINFKDMMTLLQKPLQNNLFNPWDDVGVANTPLPITLGAVRNIPALLRTTDTAVPGHLHYQIHDAQLTAIATVRDKGAPLSPNSAPPQYGPDSTLGSFYVAAPPVGKLTLDCSSMGSQVVIPGIADVLAGAGLFPAASWGAHGSAPPGFAIDTLTGCAVYQRGGIYGGTANQLAMGNTVYAPWDPASSNFGFHIHSSANYFVGGSTYIITAKISNVQGAAPAIIGEPTYGFMLFTALDANPASCITPSYHPINVGSDPFVTQTYSFAYTCPVGPARPLYISICSSFGVTAGAFGTIEGITAQLVGSYNAQQQLPLIGINLSDYVREIMARAKILPAAYSTTDTDAIIASIVASTPATPPSLNWQGGYSLGEHFSAPVNCDVALQAPLDSLCAVAFTDANGVYRIRRLIDPVSALKAGAPVAATFDLTNTQYGVAAEADYAPGLTTQIGCRRNYTQLTQTDLVTDYVAVPGYLRTQFGRLSQFVLTTARNLASAFINALSAPPLDSCLDDPTQAQFEIDRVLARYDPENQDYIVNGVYVPPRFITFTICYDGAPPVNPGTGLPLMFGDIVILNYPRFGLGPVSFTVVSTPTTYAGTPFVVKDVVTIPSLQQQQITVWG